MSDEKREMSGDAIVEAARRLLKSHGVESEQFDQAAREQKARRIAAWNAEHLDDALTPTGEAELWIEGSTKQLMRWWGGRCCTCQYWEPGGPSSGSCSAIPAEESDRNIDLMNDRSRDPIETAPAFGCILWAEIDGPEVIRGRTGLAIEIGLLPRMPEGDGE